MPQLNLKTSSPGKHAPHPWFLPRRGCQVLHDPIQNKSARGEHPTHPLPRQELRLVSPPHFHRDRAGIEKVRLPGFPLQLVVDVAAELGFLSKHTTLS